MLRQKELRKTIQKRLLAGWNFVSLLRNSERRYIMNTVDIKDYTIYLGLSMLAKGLSVSPLKLQKLLYYQQSWHMVYFGEENTLFAEAPHAWVNGPVYPVIYHEYKDKVPGMCDHLKLSDFVAEGTDVMAEMKSLVERMGLTAVEVELTERVIMLYGSKTQNQLILLTHSEKPWSEQREGMAPYEYSDKPISLATMYHYYKDRYDRNRRKNVLSLPLKSRKRFTDGYIYQYWKCRISVGAQ